MYFLNMLYSQQMQMINTIKPNFIISVEVTQYLIHFSTAYIQKYQYTNITLRKMEFIIISLACLLYFHFLVLL